jgi:hypothetical protein
VVWCALNGRVVRQLNNLSCIALPYLLICRYSVDFDLKKTVTEESVRRSEIVNTRKSVKKLFEEKYKLGAAKVEKKAASAYFFSKLRF